MKIDHATIDFETFYDPANDYSLSKMQTDEYIFDSRFEIIGVSAKAGNGQPTNWFSGTHAETREFLLDSFDWETTPVCCQNTNFDGFIATQVLGIKPYLWMDTLGMGRMLYPWWKRHGLAAMAKAMAKGEKGHAVQNFAGYTRADFSPAELAAYGVYCINDSELTHDLSQEFLKRVPPQEILMIDMQVRMFTEPQFEGDIDRLLVYHQSEVERKQALVDSCVAEKKTLMSNPQFADMLRALGVTPPTKISKTTGKRTEAFAKTDKDFTALLEHPDEDVQALVAARMGVKSTIAETRALRFVQTSVRSKLPVFVNHWGAKKTGRLSGGNKMNFLNIPARGAANELRYCMKAPDGYSVVVGDSTGIELRLAMVMAGQTDAVARIRAGEDEYCNFATKLYGRIITPDDGDERDLGKVSMLSLQYQTGVHTFRNMARLRGIDLSEIEAQKIVDLYRRTYNKVKMMWNYCGRDVLNFIHNKNYLQSVDVEGWFKTNTEGFSLPSHPGVCYHNLHQSKELDWLYNDGKGEVKIYGGKVFENLCQHAARQVVMWQTVMVHRKYPVALSVYDEIVCVVPNSEVAACVAYMEYALSQSPVWCQNKVPLEGKVNYGATYADAK